MNESQIPDTPAEPMQIMPEEEVDKNVVIMVLGPDNEDITWTTESMAAEPEPASGPMNVDPLAAAATIAAQPAVAQLLQKLAMDPSVLAQALPPPAAGAVPAPAAAEPFAGSTLQHLIQQLQTTTPGTAPPAPGFGAGYEASQPPPGGAWSGHHASADYDHGDYSGSAAGGPGNWGERRGRGRGGRGSGGRGGERGRGGDGFRSNRRIPCTFFAEGRRASKHPIDILEKERCGLTFDSGINRCKYGDHCNFAHDQF